MVGDADVRSRPHELLLLVLERPATIDHGSPGNPGNIAAVESDRWSEYRFRHPAPSEKPREVTLFLAELNPRRASRRVKDVEIEVGDRLGLCHEKGQARHSEDQVVAHGDALSGMAGEDTEAVGATFDHVVADPDVLAGVDQNALAVRQLAALHVVAPDRDVARPVAGHAAARL